MLETLTCGGKAESSEDDVYAVVAGASTATGLFNAIFPDSGSEWIASSNPSRSSGSTPGAAGASPARSLRSKGLYEDRARDEILAPDSR
jgi:hypothetical protein